MSKVCQQLYASSPNMYTKWNLNSLDEIETDAVHHRIAGESPVVEKNYQCYDCNESFHSLANLGNHSKDYLWHSVELCLRCSDPVTLFIQKSPSKIVRLHSCKKSHIRYQNSDLYLLSTQIAALLCWTDTTHQPVILCDACEESFSQTSKGLYEFLKHSNQTTHNVVPYSSCKKCTMPEFKLTCSNSECCITHFCTKDNKSILKESHKVTYEKGTQ